MNDSASHPDADSKAALRPEPKFLGALKGVWLFTWRNQLAWRKVIDQLISLLALPALVYLTTGPDQSEHYFRFILNVYFLLVLPLYCLASCGAIMRDEVQADTIGFLLTRPLSRAKLFLAKYLTHMVWVQVVLAFHGLLLLIVGAAREIPEVPSLAFLFLGTQVLAVLAWGALSALMGLVTQRYMVLGLVYGFIVEVGIGRIPTNINALSITRHVQTLLGNHQSIQQFHNWSPTDTWFSLLILVLAAFLFLGIGAILFTCKEYHHTEEMQK